MTMFSLADWEKTTIEEVKRRWGNRRRELEEIERKKKEKEERIEIWKKLQLDCLRILLRTNIKLKLSKKIIYIFRKSVM